MCKKRKMMRFLTFNSEEADSHWIRRTFHLQHDVTSHTGASGGCALSLTLYWFGVCLFDNSWLYTRHLRNGASRTRTRSSCEMCLCLELRELRGPLFHWISAALFWKCVTERQSAFGAAHFVLRGSGRVSSRCWVPHYIEVEERGKSRNFEATR